MTAADRLPSSTYAERVLIGSVLRRGDWYPRVRDLVSVEDFTLDSTRQFWRQIGKLYEQDKPIDMVALADQMIAEGAPDSIIVDIMGLTDNVPDVPNVESYCRIVRESGLRRKLVFASKRIADAAADQSTDYSVLVELAHKELSEFEAQSEAGGREWFTTSDVIESEGGINTYIEREHRSGVLFPWAKVNYHTGGLRPGDLCVIAGDTGRGKTAFVLNYALYAAKRGVGVALFSLEMTAKQNANRLMALYGQFNSRVFKHSPLSDEQAMQIMGAASIVADLPIYTYRGNRRSRALTVPAMGAALRRLRAKHPIGLVIVDYLQLVRATGENRTQQVSTVARDLKNLGLELDVPIVALSQFSRDAARAGANEEPKLYQLKDSSEIEQAANTVFFVWGPVAEVSDPSVPIPVTLTIAKQRDGGAHIPLPMLQRLDCGLFTEIP